MLHADSARNRLVGIGLVSLTYLVFTFLDGSAKWLVTVMPVFMVVWIRFVMHALFASLVLLPVRGLALVRTRHMKWHMLRALMFIVMTTLNFFALQYLQLTIVASIFFTGPLIIALFSAYVLRERIDAGRWIAFVAGFGGVLVIVQPFSAHFHPAMLLAVANAFMYAAFQLMTRRLAAYDAVGSSRVDLQACKLEYSIVSPK